MTKNGSSLQKLLPFFFTNNKKSVIMEETETEGSRTSLFGRRRRMHYNESEEMYLETILLLSRSRPSVRSIDIAEELNYSRPSVSRAVSLLKNKEYIVLDKSGEIVLTAEGKACAEAIYARHRVLTRLLMAAGADEKLATENACRMEHVISEDMFEILKDYVEKL